MGKLSPFSYVWKCVLGLEVIYAICLIGGFLRFRSERGIEAHHALFETLPGFTWINAASAILGAVYMLVFACIFGLFMVWMHNSSIKEEPSIRRSL